jgi:hypothetical protein
VKNAKKLKIGSLHHHRNWQDWFHIRMPPMGKKKSDDRYSDEEATRRMNEASRRALTSPPKPHSEMKVGKRKPKATTKASPPKKRGRPKK